MTPVGSSCFRKHLLRPVSGRGGAGERMRPNDSTRRLSTLRSLFEVLEAIRTLRTPTEWLALWGHSKNTCGVKCQICQIPKIRPASHSRTSKDQWFNGNLMTCWAVGGFLPEATPNGSDVLVQGRKFPPFPPARFRWFHSDRILQDVKQRTLWLRSWEEKGKARWWVCYNLWEFACFFVYYFCSLETRGSWMTQDWVENCTAWTCGKKRLRRHSRHGAAEQVPVCFSMSSFFNPCGPELVTSRDIVTCEWGWNRIQGFLTSVSQGMARYHKSSLERSRYVETWMEGLYATVRFTSNILKNNIVKILKHKTENPVEFELDVQHFFQDALWAPCGAFATHWRGGKPARKKYVKIW